MLAKIAQSPSPPRSLQRHREIDYNLTDAICVSRNVILNLMLAPGAEVTDREMAVSVSLQAKAKTVVSAERCLHRAAADATEVILRRWR
jgi:chaperonin GroEL (HSP60 family)